MRASDKLGSLQAGMGPLAGNGRGARSGQDNVGAGSRAVRVGAHDRARGPVVAGGSAKPTY